MDPPTQTSQRALTGANVHVRMNDDGYISVSNTEEKIGRHPSLRVGVYSLYIYIYIVFYVR